ncbi:RDD family protein [Streptomyces sp. NPDC008139]|uniref:RDD family protein n=1 Tax=Streptomyces sp. NPDC008139 TaxID=3364814 RepID=UPI0036F07CA9
MSAPTSGSSGSSSASPAPGYYPDPSVPNYIRYWNGSTWVPGTSRPAPAAGEAPVPSPSPSSSPPPAPAMDESGPMFLDEDPGAPHSDFGTSAPAPASAPEPAPAWPRPAGQAPGAEPPRISWGAAGTAAAPGVPAQQSRPAAERPQPQTPPHQPQAQPQPHAQAQAQPQPHAQPRPQATPKPEPQAQPQPQAAPWAQQVHHLARQSAGEQERPAGEERPAPWRPPAGDPFLSMISAQGRPGALVRRFAARVVDTVLFCAVTAAAAVPLGTAAYHHIHTKVDDAKQSGETVKVWLIDGTTGLELAVVLLVAVLAGLLLEVLPTVKWGCTLGKKLVGLRVLDVEAQIPPTFGPSLRRWLTHTVLDVLVVGVIGLAWCLFDRPWRQCWHDKAARTFVAAD